MSDGQHQGGENNVDRSGQRFVGRRRIGVLLVNLGTPDEPTAPAVRRYLAEFLSDPRIVDLPRILWLPILHGLILNTRPAATAHNYKKIWREETNESPLRYFTRTLAVKTQANAAANATGGEFIIDWAMRYGNPSIIDRMTALKEKGCDHILIVPLYPQYSDTTTASVADAVSKAVSMMGRPPALRTVPAFFDDPAYIDALAAVTRRRLSTLDWAPTRIVISFHGLPQRSVDAGDPYHNHCMKTASLLRDAMGWTDEFAPVAFQSKFGRAKWLEPATEATIKALGEQGVKNLAVMTPGFVADCIETLEEIGIAAHKTFLAAGGENFDTIPCLNDELEMILLLDRLIQRETAGWLKILP
jgi:protoporphyrin/coproporphyrin ferrochelatase